MATFFKWGCALGIAYLVYLTFSDRKEETHGYFLPDSSPSYSQSYKRPQRQRTMDPQADMIAGLPPLLRRSLQSQSSRDEPVADPISFASSSGGNNSNSGTLPFSNATWLHAGDTGTTTRSGYIKSSSDSDKWSGVTGYSRPTGRRTREYRYSNGVSGTAERRGNRIEYRFDP